MARVLARVALALWLAACSSPTEIVVVVDSSRAVPGQLDALRILVEGSEVAHATLDSPAGLPATLGVAAEGGRGDLGVAVEGLVAASAVTIAGPRRLDFVQGTRRVLYVFFGPDAVGETCELPFSAEVLQHTDTSRCETALQDGGADAGGRDAGRTDAGSTDAGGDDTDAGSDTDAGADSGIECQDGCPDTECATRTCVEGTCQSTPVNEGGECNRETDVGPCIHPTCVFGGGSRTIVTRISRCASGACAAPTASDITQDIEVCAGDSEGQNCDATQLSRRCCGGACVSTTADESHCGGCGLTCGGTCASAPAEPDQGLCGCFNINQCPNRAGWMCGSRGDGSNACLCSSDMGCATGQTCGGDGRCRYPAG